MSSTGTLSPPARDVAQVADVPTEQAEVAPVATVDEDLADVLVEEVSIDGMCGVY